MILLDKYEYFAVGHYLSSWPEDFTYTEIIENLKADNDFEYWPVEQYEGIPPEDLAYLITEMLQGLYELTKEG